MAQGSGLRVMLPWLWELFSKLDFDTTETLNAAVDTFDEREETHRRSVIRRGYAGLVADMAKETRLLVGRNGKSDQLPLFAAVQVDGHWLRVQYHHQSLNQLSATYERELKLKIRSDAITRRLAADLVMYQRHPELPELIDVWQTEGVEFRIEAAELSEATA